MRSFNPEVLLFADQPYATNVNPDSLHPALNHLFIKSFIFSIVSLSSFSCTFDSVRQLLSSAMKRITRNKFLVILGKPDMLIAHLFGEKCSNSFLNSFDNFSILISSSLDRVRGLTLFGNGKYFFL